MRTFFLTILLLVFSVCMAQDYPTKENLKPIDKMNMRLMYDVEWRYNMKNPKEMMHDKMYTEIGKIVCHSFIEREWKNEVKFNKKYEKEGKRGTNGHSALYSNFGEIFLGYPKGKTTNIYSLDALGTYKYEEASPKLKWTITNETLDTLDYHCILATCRYAGREYRAWFCEDIPISFGPWKLYGLPGLIIKAETLDGDYRFVLSGIETTKTDTDICIWNRDFINTSKKKTRKQEKMLLTEPIEILEQLGLNFSFVSYDGTKAKMKILSFDNPLEKE